MSAANAFPDMTVAQMQKWLESSSIEEIRRRVPDIPEAPGLGDPQARSAAPSQADEGRAESPPGGPEFVETEGPMSGVGETLAAMLALQQEMLNAMLNMPREVRDELVGE